MVDRTYRLCGGPGDFRPARGQGYGVWAIEQKDLVSRLRLRPIHRACFGKSPNF
jgi:hypothetical protein